MALATSMPDQVGATLHNSLSSKRYMFLKVKKIPKFGGGGTGITVAWCLPMGARAARSKRRQPRKAPFEGVTEGALLGCALGTLVGSVGCFCLFSLLGG